MHLDALVIARMQWTSYQSMMIVVRRTLRPRKVMYDVCVTVQECEALACTTFIFPFELLCDHVLPEFMARGSWV
jgi:hypothetical protein